MLFSRPLLFVVSVISLQLRVKPDLRDGGPFPFFSLLRKRAHSIRLPASGRVTAERRYYYCNWVLNSQFSILNYVTSFHDSCRDSG